MGRPYNWTPYNGAEWCVRVKGVRKKPNIRPPEAVAGDGRWGFQVQPRGPGGVRVLAYDDKPLLKSSRRGIAKKKRRTHRLITSSDLKRLALDSIFKREREAGRVKPAKPKRIRCHRGRIPRRATQ